jgi:hypothetical protein
MASDVVLFNVLVEINARWSTKERAPVLPEASALVTCYISDGTNWERMIEGEHCDGSR